MGSLDGEKLKHVQNSPRDEFGVTHENLIYNKEDKLFCLLDVPDKEAVEKHHHKLGISCDWIMEVGTTKEKINPQSYGCDFLSCFPPAAKPNRLVNKKQSEI
jgi:hypothetical protein